MKKVLKVVLLIAGAILLPIFIVCFLAGFGNKTCKKIVDSYLTLVDTTLYYETDNETEILGKIRS